MRHSSHNSALCVWDELSQLNFVITGVCIYYYFTYGTGITGFYLTSPMNGTDPSLKPNSTPHRTLRWNRKYKKLPVNIKTGWHQNWAHVCIAFIPANLPASNFGPNRSGRSTSFPTGHSGSCSVVPACVVRSKRVSFRVSPVLRPTRAYQHHAASCGRFTCAHGPGAGVEASPPSGVVLTAGHRPEGHLLQREINRFGTAMASRLLK